MMDTEFINPVLRSMVNTFSMMAQFEPRPGKPYVKSQVAALGDISGVISMSGPSVNGSMSISFEKSTILELTQRILQAKATEIDEMVADLAGELTNIVTGGAKSELDDLGYEIDMSTPKIFLGKDHVFKHNSQAPIIVLPFQSEIGCIFVELCFDPGVKKKSL